MAKHKRRLPNASRARPSCHPCRVTAEHRHLVVRSKARDQTSGGPWCRWHDGPRTVQFPVRSTCETRLPRCDRVWWPEQDSYRCRPADWQKPSRRSTACAACWLPCGGAACPPSWARHGAFPDPQRGRCHIWRASVRLHRDRIPACGAGIEKLG